MQEQKLDYKMYKSTKSDVGIPPVLNDFEKKNSLILQRGKSDEMVTHQNNTDPKNLYQYRGNSKFWEETDPKITDRKSIQYNAGLRVYLLMKLKNQDKWVFPSAYIPSTRFLESHIDDMLGNFFTKEHRPYFKVIDIMPSLCVKEPIPEEEMEKNKIFSKCRGKKTFYFNAYHINGGYFEINPELFDDFVWASRLELPQYLDEETYNKTVHATSLD